MSARYTVGLTDEDSRGYEVCSDVWAPLPHRQVCSHPPGAENTATHCSFPGMRKQSPGL